MAVYEAECVSMKRRGAEYVRALLAGKSKQEQLDFWMKRSKRLLAKQTHQQSQMDELNENAESHGLTTV